MFLLDHNYFYFYFKGALQIISQACSLKFYSLKHKIYFEIYFIKNTNFREIISQED